MKRLILFALMLVLLCNIASAFTCHATNASRMDFFRSFEWVCEVDDPLINYSCSSVVEDNESNTMQVNPDPFVNKAENEIIGDYFENRNGLVRVYFTQSNLFNGRNYTFIVKCSPLNGSVDLFNESFTVHYSNIWNQRVIDKVIWFKDNVFYVVAAILLIMGALIILTLILNR